MKKLLRLLALPTAWLCSAAYAQSPVLVKDFYDGPNYYTHIGTTLFFSASDSNNGFELWKSDGTTAGTVLVKDIYPGSRGSNPHHLTNLNGTLYFTANTGTAGVELWKSDGTAAGTVMVKDIRPGTDSGLDNIGIASSLTPFPVVNNRLVFRAIDGVNGDEMWASDGTTAGTTLLRDLYAGASGSYPDLLTVMGNHVYFRAATRSGADNDVWRTDGTAAGTQLVYDRYPAGSGSGDNITQLARVGNQLYFTSNAGYTGTVYNGTELMRSDGTPAGTVAVKRIGVYAQANNVYGASNRLYVSIFSDAEGFEPWVSNGTSAGTFMLRDVNSGTDFSSPSRFFEHNGLVYFEAATAANGRELWRTDGTTAGTVLVKDIYPGTSSANISYMTTYGNKTYFLSNDGVAGSEIWTTNGTTAGTTMLFNAAPGYAYGAIQLYAAANALYFTGSSATAQGLFKVGGLPTGTRPGSAPEVSLYPSPTTGLVHLAAPTLAPYSVSVLNALGQVVFESPAPLTMLDLSAQAPGIYSVQLRTADATITRKLIRQ